MFRVDAHKPAHFCDGLTRRDFLHAGSLAAARPRPARRSTPWRRRARSARTATSTASCSSWSAGPSQLDTWDMKPDAPDEIRGPFQPIDDERARASRSARSSRGWPAMMDKVVAGPVGLPHGDRRPRHRPPDDADRPALHRRDRAPARRLRPRRSSRARAATPRRTSCCPGRSAPPAATCRTARTPATSARRSTRSS